ncbi:MAG: hypothetical protein ACI9ES_001611, partial [Oceanospirillaceae bacterium]
MQLEEQRYPNLLSTDKSEFMDPVTQLAPRPTTIKDTGLSESLLLDLLLKHFLAGGVLTKEQMVSLIGVTGGIIQHLLDSAKALAWVENRQTTSDGQMRYSLSAGGELHAKQALTRNGYLGLAPVPLKQYGVVCRKQSSRANPITFEMLEQSLSSLVLPKDLLFKIGPAMNSSRPVLIYGPPGTGKSYLCRHLNLAIGDNVLIPYALAIGNEVIQVFDPELHHQVENKGHISSLNL